MSSNNKYDYIVVGQGLAGTLLTLDLLDNKKRILIVDKHLKGSASKVAGGLMNPISVRRCIPAFPDHYLTVAFKRYKELEEKLNNNFLYTKPLVKLFRNDEIRDLWHDKYNSHDMDIYIKGFNKSNTFSSFKDTFTSANIEPAGNLDVAHFLSISKSYFSIECDFLEEEFDFNFFNESEVSYKGYTSEKIVFCEGYRLMNNPFFKYLPLAPTKGEVITIKIPSLEYCDQIISKGVYLIPLGNHLYTVGATYNREDLTDEITDDGQRFLIERLEGILNLDYEIVDRQSGIRPTVKDHKPLIGYHPDNNRIGVFNGLGSRGVLAGPYLSNQFVYSSLDTIKRFKKNS